MFVRRKLTRTILLALALTLSVFALRPSPGLAACVNGSTRFVAIPGVCCCCYSQKQKGQSCIFGTWTDNGATRCAGACAI